MGKVAAEKETNGFDFAVGLSKYALRLADETGSFTYTEIMGDATFTPENIRAIANQAKTIRFTARGINWARWGHWVNTSPQSWSPYLEHTTNWELHQLLTNAPWLSKTVFH